MGSRSQNLLVIMMWRAPLLVAVLQSCAALNFGRGENDINDKCVDCVGEGSATHTRFSTPLATLGEKEYFSRPTGTRLSSTAGSMGCISPASTPPKSRGT